MGAVAVDVWLADLDAAASALDDLNTHLRLLPAEECARAAGLGDPMRVRRWRSARVALRLVLATHVGLARARAPFSTSSRGKPALLSPGLEFSLSHSGSLLLFAVSSIGPLGIDIETRTTVDMDARRREAIERAAQTLAPSAPLPMHGVRRFLQAWTRLEAVAKATGAGIGQVLGELQVRGPSSGSGERQPESAATLLAGKDYPLSVQDLALDTEAVAAIAVPMQASLTLRAFPVSPSGMSALEALAQRRG